MENNSSNEPSSSQPENVNPEKEKKFSWAVIKDYIKDLNFSGKKRTTLLIIAILLFTVLGGGFFYFQSLGPNDWPLGPSFFGKKQLSPDFFSGFFPMDVEIKAKDDFTLQPEKSDSLGVATDSAYILRSKKDLSGDITKAQLKFEPEISYEIKKSSNREWRVEPKESLAPNTLLKVTLANYQENAENYTWAYQVQDKFKVLHSVPRNTGTNVPVNSGIEITFSHDNFTDYEKYFEITPAVSGIFEQHGRTLVYVPKDPLSAQTIYTVTVKKGLPIRDSQEKLEEEYSFRFETEAEKTSVKRNQYLRIHERTLEFTTEHRPVIQVSAQDVSEGPRAEVFQFSSWKEYMESLRTRDKLPWWSYSKDEFQVDTKNLRKISSFDLEIKNNDQKEYIEFPEALSRGFYLAEISQGDSKTQVWIQVSNLTAYYNITKTDTIIWVNDAKDKETVEEAEIELVGADKVFKTNQEGIVVFPTLEQMIASAEEEDHDNLYFRISQNDDMLIVPASQISRNYWWAKPEAADDYWRYLYTDRPRYQPTDTIYYWGLLKPRSNDKIDEKITVTLYKEGYVDYYYQPVSIVEQKVSLSGSSTFEGEIKVADLRPDYYTLEVKAGEEVIERKYISIKPYTKPAFQLTLTPDKKAAFAGENINLKAKASFFEGTPVPNLNLVFKTPEGNHSFTTNENGEADLTYTKEYVLCTKAYSCWPNYAYLKIEPASGELAEINATANVRFYGPRISAKSNVSYPEKGLAEIKIRTHYIDLAKINEDYWRIEDEDQKAAPGIKIEGKVIKITHHKEETGTQYDFINKKTYKTYSYSTSEEEVRTFSGLADDNGKYTLKQSVEPEVSYRVEYKVYDQDGRSENYSNHLYYYNGKHISHYSNWDYNYYHLDLNQEEFSLGEEVEVTMKNNDESMAEGKRRYLFMQLQNGLQEYRVQDQSEYNFEFDWQDVPNVNLAAVYFNGVSYVTTASDYMSEQANYKYEDRDLQIKVAPDKESYSPGEEVNLKVQVKNKNNDPVEAEVNLNLVDEAYYAVAEDVANPLETIYASVSSGSAFSDKTHNDPLESFMGAEKGGCFAAGTMITMADGSEKPIEKVEKGDHVLTLTDPVSRELAEGEVTETWKHTVAEYVIINNELKVTPEHQVFSNNRFIDAGLLKKGDWLLNLEGEKIFISSITFAHEIITVYNLRVDPTHTFFAGGVYVHNEEKGGGPREFFTDAALFRIVKTNSSGEAQVSFQLPHNITSWRITSQAISANLEAGVSVTKLPVSLPVFADLTIGQEYLISDQPVARMRAYGASLSENDQVSFTVEAPTLGMSKSEPIETKAYLPAFYPFSKLSSGKHQVVYNLETDKGNDAIKLPLAVISSRLEAQVAKNEKLSAGTKVEAINNLPMAIVLADEGKNQLYNPLLNLSGDYGDRVDQKYVRVESRKLLHDYYQEEIVDPNFHPSDYQLANGGISLLPYSSEELELSARVASIGAEGFDKESLSQYFFQKLEDKKSNSKEISWSLYGLAELREPVLTRIDSWLNREDLSAKEKIYLAQALFDLGDEERSRQLYYEVLKEYGQKKDPHIVIRSSADLDEVFLSTASAAVLAASLQATEADGLFDYLLTNQKLYGQYKNSENLFNLEKLNYISHRLPQLKPSPSKVTYELEGQKKEIKLTGATYSFQVTPELVDSLKFVSVTGDVGISVRYTEPIDLSSVERDPQIAISRKYYVNGQPVDKFSENDMVEVRLYPFFSSGALAGEYQITDILPSGLAPISKLYTGDGKRDCHYWYPYNTDGQMVKYKINRDWKNHYCGGNYIKYYARVKNRGTYQAEPAIIQSFVNPDYINYSGSQTIIIGE